MPHREYIRIVPGAKTAVLMVHGIVGTPRHFDFLLDLIPEDVSVVNMLLEGHGGKVPCFSQASMKAWRAQVKNALEDLCKNHEQVFVVAHSMGTLLTAEASCQFPQVKGMLYLSVPLRIRLAPGMITASLRWCFGRLRSDHPKEQALGHAAGVEPNPRLWLYLGWLPRFWELFLLSRSSRPLMEQLKLPVFAFLSHDDEVVRRSTAKHLAKNPNIQYTMLPGCGHFYYTAAAEDQMRSAFQQLLEL